ncbi:unnamed protein product [Soboliphyme baturini]|uniref:Uncharacterized protein n=1 Tax=Soboliphyme baturini TaxID=241478 RepID=A0A183J3L5_9BILA|nr:unnamed protein product [Soboliphyme baturini]
MRLPSAESPMANQRPRNVYLKDMQVTPCRSITLLHFRERARQKFKNNTRYELKIRTCSAVTIVTERDRESYRFDRYREVSPSPFDARFQSDVRYSLVDTSEKISKRKNDRLTLSIELGSVEKMETTGTSDPTAATAISTTIASPQNSISLTIGGDGTITGRKDRQRSQSRITHIFPNPFKPVSSTTVHGFHTFTSRCYLVKTRVCHSLHLTSVFLVRVLREHSLFHCQRRLGPSSRRNSKNLSFYAYNHFMVKLHCRIVLPLAHWY